MTLAVGWGKGTREREGRALQGRRISVVYMFLIETSCEDSDYEDDDDDGRTDSWMDGFEKQRAQYRFSTSTTTFPHSPATTTTPWAEEEGRSVCRGMLGGLLTHFHEKKRHNKL